jgi:predicted aspartyl protease
MLAAAVAPGCVVAQAQRGARVPLSFDRMRRPLAPVRINGRGPFSFVIDTAAQQTGLGANFIREAGLIPNGQRATLHGASGATSVDLYTLGSVEIGPLHRENLIGVPLQHAVDEHGGHAGVLGAGILANSRATFDYAGLGLLIELGENRPPLPRAVDIQLLHNIFILAAAQIGETPVAAILDTGARHSIGNLALQAALGFTRDDPRLRPAAATGGATGHAIESRAGIVGGVTLGGVRTASLELAFAALPVFAALGVADRPAVIVGADVFHQWSGFTVDYGSRHLAVMR